MNLLVSVMCVEMQSSKTIIEGGMTPETTQNCTRFFDRWKLFMIVKREAIFNPLVILEGEGDTTMSV